MQDVSIPLSSMIVPVLLIVSLEMLTSVISLKSIKFRQLLQGNSIILIKDGKLDQSQLKSLRMTTDDLLEELRKKDVFDISTVQYAVVETDGSLSVMLKAGETGVKNKNMDYSTKEVTMPYVIVSDGRILAMRDERSPYYDLPGGRVRMGETAERAVIREAEEELRVTPRIVRPLWLNQSFFTEDVDHLRYHEICVYYLTDVSETKISETGRKRLFPS